ncbi:Proline-serine-threonine phosphatase-interacting protein 2 [Mortierella sp. GBA30]|nr:Proline-serine-threonine phosphatase-interacting protein 2 [Mortierella sp. GBA30]
MNTERAASEATSAPRFSQNFWGKDDAGYSALTTRMRHAKLTCQEILTMFQARAALEEEYGKKLLKLSKSPLGKDELGSLRDSLDVIRYEIETTGKSHIELANKMRDQLESALAEFNNSQKDKRKLAKEKYDLECIRTKGLSAAKMNLVGKELDKVSMKMEKTELASRAAEYQASIRQLIEINDKWAVEWRCACDKFQVLEEQRIDYLRLTLWNYANIISSSCVADDESCERIRSALELCDVNHDMQSFIEAYATGDDIPDIPAHLISRGFESVEMNAVESPAVSHVHAQAAKARTVSGPHQLIPGVSESSAPSSRRQSFYSTDGRSEPEALSRPVEMALTVGSNVFKLDPQMAAKLSQADEVSTLPGRHPTMPKPSHEEDIPTASSDPRQSPHLPASQENSLGISLDVSGTVTENRFPHWQSQAPLQSFDHLPGSMMPSSLPRNMYQPHQENPSSCAGSRISDTQGRSQIAPAQSGVAEASPQHADQVDCRNHGRSLDSVLTYHQHHGEYEMPSNLLSAHTQQQFAPPQQQTTPEGRPILFYVRAMYDYEATIPEELSFKEGDILAVLLAREDGWWEGNHLGEYCGPVRGLFPSNFTEPTQ